MKLFSENVVVDFNDDSEKKRDFTENELMLLKEMLLSLEKAIDDIPLRENANSEASFPGEYIFELLGKASISKDSSGLFTTLIDQIVQYLNALKNSQGAGGPFQKTGGALDKLANFLKIVFQFEKKSFEEHVVSVKECYKVFVTLEKPKPTFRKNAWASTVKDDTKPGGKVVNFWCFNPGYGMRGLLNLGVHCIIVTSGTLSPLPPLISELGIPINITLENKHVITKDQVFVSVVRCGPDNEPLTSVFKNRSNDNYITSLGRTIVNFARIIPEGLLVFFPSYSALNQCKEHWERSGIWNQIFAIKEIFVEPQGKRDLKDVMNGYYSRIVQPGSKGACFLAVCRGKVSEGLDFADQNGRAVILTGLPYPPFKDPRVVMKREYLDKNKKKVTGHNWYQLEATRAVNQAVGRVIRHRHDYGAVLFCDARFAEPGTKNQMSAWLRPYIQTPAQFGAVTRGLCQFFKFAREQLPQPAKKDMSVAWGEASSEPAAPSKAVPAFFDTTSKWISKKSAAESRGGGNFKWSGQEPSTPWKSVSPYSQSSSSSTQKKNRSKSMFGALEESVQVIDFNSMAPSPEESPAATLKDCTNSCDTPTRLDSDERPPEPKRRKLKVMGVQLNYEQSDASSSSTSSPASSKEARKSQMRNYLELVKKKLPSSDMKMFNTAVMEYSRHSNYDQLISTLTCLFSDPSLHDCIRGFDACIKVAHREQFSQLCKAKYYS